MKKGKKFAVFLLLTAMLSILTPVISHLSGTNALVQAATYKISQTNATVYLGDTLQLKVSGLKKGDKVTWSSDNKEVASVSSKGVVTPKTPNAAAKITAKVKYNYTYKYKSKGKYKYKTTVKTKKLYCTINIIYPPLERKLNVTEQLVGAGYNFELSVIDADPYDKITYSVRDPLTASVDTYSGRVSARAYGPTEIYADVISSDGTQSCRLTCKVEVVPQSQARGLNYYSKDVEQFKDFRLQVTNASNVDYIEYESSDPNVVAVTNTGTSYATVTGVSIGTAYITARIKKTGNVVEIKNCRVVVKEYDKNRSISTTSTTLVEGSSAQVIISNLQPQLDTVQYESDNSSVVSVSESGIVTYAGAGIATIKATITFPTGESTTLTTTITCIAKTS